MSGRLRDSGNRPPLDFRDAIMMELSEIKGAIGGLKARIEAVTEHYPTKVEVTREVAKEIAKAAPKPTKWGRVLTPLIVAIASVITTIAAHFFSRQ